MLSAVKLITCALLFLFVRAEYNFDKLASVATAFIYQETVLADYSLATKRDPLMFNAFNADSWSKFVRFAARNSLQQFNSNMLKDKLLLSFKLEKEIPEDSVLIAIAEITRYSILAANDILPKSQVYNWIAAAQYCILANTPLPKEIQDKMAILSNFSDQFIMDLQFGIDDLQNPICSTIFNEEQFCLDFSQELPDLDQLNKLGNSFSCALIDCNHAQKSQFEKLLDGPIGSKLKRIVMIPSEDFDLNESILKLPHLQQIIIQDSESDGQMVSITGSLNRNSIEIRVPFNLYNGKRLNLEEIYGMQGTFYLHQTMGLKDQKKSYAGLQRLIARLGADCTLAESKVLKRTKITSDNEKVRLLSIQIVFMLEKLSQNGNFDLNAFEKAFLFSDFLNFVDVHLQLIGDKELRRKFHDHPEQLIFESLGIEKQVMEGLQVVYNLASSVKDALVQTTPQSDFDRLVMSLSIKESHGIAKREIMKLTLADDDFHDLSIFKGIQSQLLEINWPPKSLNYEDKNTKLSLVMKLMLSTMSNAEKIILNLKSHWSPTIESSYSWYLGKFKNPLNIVKISCHKNDLNQIANHFSHSLKILTISGLNDEKDVASFTRNLLKLENLEDLHFESASEEFQKVFFDWLTKNFAVLGFKPLRIHILNDITSKWEKRIDNFFTKQVENSILVSKRLSSRSTLSMSMSAN